MSQYSHELEIFSILDKEKITKIIDLLDESIVKDQFRTPQLQNLEKLGFTEKQSRDIIQCFFNFYSALPYPDEMNSFIDHLDFDNNVKNLVKDTFETIKKNGDKSKVTVANRLNKLQHFGHDHLHGIEAISEFRPVMVDKKLQNITTAIVVEINLQNTDHTKKTHFTFQTDLEGFEHMMQELNKQLIQIKTERQIMKEKIGDDTVGV